VIEKYSQQKRGGSRRGLARRKKKTLTGRKKRSSGTRSAKTFCPPGRGEGGFGRKGSKGGKKTGTDPRLPKRKIINKNEQGMHQKRKEWTGGEEKLRLCQQRARERIGWTTLGGVVNTEGKTSSLIGVVITRARQSFWEGGKTSGGKGITRKKEEIRSKSKKKKRETEAKGGILQQANTPNDNNPGS